MKKIFISSDHAGFTLKEQIKKKFSKKYMFLDLGTNNSHVSVNYPDFAHKLCKKVSNNNKNTGILICGSGFGVAIAANRYPHIRAVTVRTPKEAEMSRLHNDANVLCLGADFTSTKDALKIIDKFLTTKFEGGRHQKRIDKLKNMFG